MVRSGFAESRHRGAVVVLGADGHLRRAAGEVTEPLFPRSSVKPMQAAGMLRHGLDIDGKLLALAAASHSGEDFHVAGVREILAGPASAKTRCVARSRCLWTRRCSRPCCAAAAAPTAST